MWEGSEAPQVSRMGQAGSPNFKKAKQVLCRSMEEEKEGTKFQTHSRDSGGKARKEA